MSDPDINAANAVDNALPDEASEETPRASALLQLLSQSGAQRILQADKPDLGLAEHLPYPFMAVVGQMEMRIALLLSVINPSIGGTLLIGPRGTGKTTIVRSLAGILPDVEVSDCEEGVFSEDLQTEDAQYLYPDCHEKFHAGQPISHFEPVKLIELPLNARLEDVVGGINERVAVQRNLVRLEKGILARADRHILYIDEVNLLDDRITDAILDAAAQGSYTVRRGAMVGTYRSRFILIGSMNPEEGRLRPQILDRFGLRVHVRGLTTYDERLEVYKRAQAYRHNPLSFIEQWALASEETLIEVIEARERLKQTKLDEEALRLGLALIQALEIDSHRADYALFEAARAYAAADGRLKAIVDDIRAVAPMALRQRRSEFMSSYLEQQHREDEQIREALERFTS
jgi:magnesium chelatase subunit I